MRIVWTMIGCFTSAALLLVIGCGERHEVRHRDRETVVVEEQPRTVVFVREAPPREIVEVRSARPGPDFVWVDGYHRWDDGRHGYVWVGGRWDRPPHHGAVWVKHEYVKVHDRDRDGYEYHPGHWK